MEIFEWIIALLLGAALLAALAQKLGAPSHIYYRSRRQPSHVLALVVEAPGYRA